MALKSSLIDPTLGPSTLENCEESPVIDCSGHDDIETNLSLTDHEQISPSGSLSSCFKVGYEQHDDISHHRDVEDNTYVQTAMEGVHSLQEIELVKGEPDNELQTSRPLSPQHTLSGADSASHSSSTNHVSLFGDREVTLSDSSSIAGHTSKPVNSQLTDVLKSIASHEGRARSSVVTVVHPQMLSRNKFRTYNTVISQTQIADALHNKVARMNGKVKNRCSSARYSTPTIPTGLFRSTQLPAVMGASTVTASSGSSSTSILVQTKSSDRHVANRHVVHRLIKPTLNSEHLQDMSPVPDVAMETVVTTDMTRRRCGAISDSTDETHLPSFSSSPPSQGSLITIQPELSEDAIISSAAGCMPISGIIKSEAGALNINHQYMITVPEPSGAPVVVSSCRKESDISNSTIAKREREKMKKREQRSDPEYKEKEKINARERMRITRANPMYRDNERLRDKIRRQQARLCNPSLRALERERDKHNKRLNRLRTTVTGQQVMPLDSLQEDSDSLIF